MSLATDESKNSDDPKAKTSPSSAVGAVLTASNVVLAASANRFPTKLRGIYSIIEPTSPDRYVFLEHAERCAIFDAFGAGCDLQNATIYCTRFPCVDCARAIVYVGISRIVVGQGFTAEKHWIDSQRAALGLLRTSGITVRYL